MVANEGFVVERAAPGGRDARVMVRALRRDLRSRFTALGWLSRLCSPALLVAADVRWRLHHSAHFAPPNGLFLIARDAEGAAIGCGGLCRHDDGTSEIRRMYVSPQMRGRGVARGILDALISAARESGYERIRLETSDRQTEALNLYRSAGFHRTPSWGPFAARSHSRCFELLLSGSEAGAARAGQAGYR
jgi:GNAT superfamily N-acetyltransferase